MSYRVMIIPEDYVLDQYIVKPLTRQLLHDLNKQNAKVEVCTNPRFRGNKGKTGVLNAENILTVVRLYPMYDLYIALVDRDGDPNRQAELDGLEQAVRAQLAPGQTFIAEDAHQEVEVWVLAGHPLPKPWKWDEIRTEANPKEKYYLPFARQRGVLASVGGGRKVLMEEAMSEWARLLGRCPEDVGRLKERLAEVV